MPLLECNGAKISYESTGDGPETIVFAHGLLWSGDMFAAQVAEFSKRYRCVTFDFRGQGKTPVTPGGYGMDDLTNDAVALIETLGVGPVHFAGLSMGGFVAMRLGARRPDLVRSLILLETSAGPEPPEKIGSYKQLAFVGRWLGFGVVASQVMPIMFGKTFVNDPARKTERDYWRARLIANDRIGVQRALGGVIERASIEDELGKITAPTLVIVGDEDVATVPAKAERIRDGIAGAKLVVIPKAGHSSTIEEPQAVNAAIARFLADVSASTPAPTARPTPAPTTTAAEG
jgi:pimeloyl-ACP methyl ester carboxylesterase